MSQWYEVVARTVDGASKYAGIPARFKVKSGNPLAARAAFCRFYSVNPSKVDSVTEITDPTLIAHLEVTTIHPGV